MHPYAASGMFYEELVGNGSTTDCYDRLSACQDLR